jgi:hypothetical protein
MFGASFENGASGFRPYNLASSVTQTVVSDGTAYSGSSFLRARTTQAEGSVAMDFLFSEFAGNCVGRSHHLRTVGAWARSILRYPCDLAD